MERFIGVKEVLAKPMTRQEYVYYCGWGIPADENGDDNGYLVEYLDVEQPNHPDHNGYISWSPEGVFERAYRATKGMTFGLAIEAAKKGHRVARKGWNGKNMFVVYMPGQVIPAEKVSEHTRLYIGENQLLNLQPYFAMFNAQEEWIPGWLASQSDMLADDWLVV